MDAQGTTNGFTNGTGVHVEAPSEIELTQPFETFDAADWNGIEPEMRRWLTQDQIPLGEPGILSGDGGLGKTLISLQLMASTALDWSDWLGKIIETHGPVLLFSVEEKLAELHRRTVAITSRRGIEELPRGRMHFISDPKEHILARSTRGEIAPTVALHRLEKTVERLRPVLIIIENAADVFGGNEIDRAQVTQFVRFMLGGLCVACGATVLLLQHPSVAGLTAGDGRSGSTAWNNSGRFRLNLKAPKKPGAEDDGDDDDTRELVTEKLNYGRKGERIKIRWDAGVFRVDMGPTSMEAIARHAKAEEMFITLLREAKAQGRNVSDLKSPTYAPAVFSKMPSAQTLKLTSGIFAAAMERLFAAKKIRAVTEGPPSKTRNRIEEGA